ncbi:MAG: dockerin type I repeat-containing protein [Clostridia bacterium]|nr:dockerin type I repeat-containing protein [Clostridia bacterium]
MTNKISRKVISCILAVVMLFGVTSTAFAAKGVYYQYPVIVINGIDNNPLYANPGTVSATKIFPPEDTTVAFLTAQMYVGGIVALASNDYDQVMNYFVGDQLFEVLERVQLNPDGTSKSSNIGPIVYEYPLSYYYTDIERYELIAGEIGMGMADSLGANNVYVFTYDWRIDPLENAHMLDSFIQNVKGKAGSEKVSIISEGYGSTVATTYLAECYENATADVDNFVTVNSAFMGSSLIGDIYTGRLARNYNELMNTTSAFIRYTNDISDNPLTWFATWLVNYILNNEWETQDLIAQCLTMMGHIVDDMYDNYLIEMLQNYTGLWAMVPVEYYDEAMDMMFNGDEYNSDLQEKIQTFKNYQESADEILQKAKSEGININIVSTWNIQIVPIGDNKASDEELFGLSAQSDGLIDTHFSSFGAYTIPFNDLGAAAQHEQINTDGECENHDHLSSEYDMLDTDYDLAAIAHYIDASTCALPDNTWFIRNMKHGTFDTKSNAMNFLVYLMTADRTLDVYSADGLYSQFMNYNRYVKPGYLVIPGATEDGKYLLGDVNLDGRINAADARLALRISARLEDYPDVADVVFKNSDVNGDGIITAADARIILRVSAGLASFSDYRNTSDII